ncbi:MAG TPA: carbohydrate kinase family protein [Roseivirga sp.]
MSYDVSLISDLCIDLLFTGNVKPEYGQVEKFVDDYQVELGGSASIFASQFRKLGGQPAFLGVLGNDAFGAFLRQKLKDLEISEEYLLQSKAKKTAVGLGLSYHDDRAMLTYKGTLEEVTPERITSSGILQASKHIHINSYFLLEGIQDFWDESIAQLKTQGMTFSLDTNWAPEGNWERVHQLLGRVDVFIPNEEEAKLIANKSSVLEAGLWLNERCPLVVVKRGAQGASVFQNGTCIDFAIPSEFIQNLQIKDTTGAGDNFCAGFVFNWLKKQPIEACVELGMKCGTSSLKEVGGIRGQLLP